MILPGARGQQQLDNYYDASGTIGDDSTAQLLIPQRKSCSTLVVQNISAGIIMIQIGIRPGVASLTSGAVSSVSVPDAGFGFLMSPTVEFLGGGNANDPASFGGTEPGWPPPFRPAQGRAIMQSSALGGLEIASITVDDPGSGYLVAPYVAITASRTDPTGVGIASATAGFLLSPTWSYYLEGTACVTTAISVWGANNGQAYTAKWMA